MHTINVGIRSDYNLVVTQGIEAIFNIQSTLEAIELVILVDDFFAKSKGVERFSFKTEYCLSVDVPRLCD